MDFASLPPWEDVLLYVGIVIGAYLLLRYAVIPLVRAGSRRTANQWDDLLADTRFVSRLSWVIPLGLGVVASPVLGFDPEVEAIVRKAAGSASVVAALLALNALVADAERVYQRSRPDADRPIKGYLQILVVVAWVVGALAVFAIASDTSLASVFAGLAALSAVLLLVFQSTILSMVASVLLTSNDMVRLGDWITLPGTDVDGDVIDIALHTVKVRNFDKTVATVPTTQLVDRSFINWRGVQAVGARRIKRHLLLDQASVRFLDPDEVERWSRFAPLAGYLAAKREELAAQPNEVDGLEPDRRRLTNLGTFRAYADAYLRAHPRLDTDHFTAMVRQLQPTAEGLPLEVYAFTDTPDWVAYEGIQADVFDHLLAQLPAFGLRVAQQPTGEDVASLAPQAFTG